MDLQALHRVRARLVRLRTGVINQIGGFLIELGITVRQGRAPEDHSETKPLPTLCADQQKPNRSSWHAHEKSRINDIGRCRLSEIS